jgi:glycosyltransferase involved in cell wall biosynthesis
MNKSSLGSRPRVLLYVNQVYADDYTGQGTFERELIGALRQRVMRHHGVHLQVFSVRRPGSVPPASHDATFLPLDKSRPISYLVHQILLCFVLARAMYRYWRYEITIFTRYAPTSLAPVVLALLRRCRLVVRTGPALRDLSPYGKRPSRATYLAVRLGFWLNCRTASCIVVVTTQIKHVIQSWFPFTREKIIIVPNGANLTLFRPRSSDRRAWGLSDDGLVLGFLGHIYEDQGIDTVIRALAQIQKEIGTAPQFLVVGGGPCLESLKTLAHQLGVSSRVTFAGQRPYTEMPSAIAACDVMLAPFTRQTFETTGSSSLKLFEYLACDKPILAARAKDHEFLAEHGVGTLVEPDDVGAWARAITNMMHVPAWHLHGGGRRLVEEQFGFDRVAADIWAACLQTNDNHGTSGTLVEANG